MYQINNQKPKSSDLLDYFQLTKPRIVVLLAITGAVAILLPSIGSITTMDVIIYVMCGYLAAGGAMAVNNAIDYDIDRKMSRTMARASTDRLSRREVVVFGSTLMFLGIFLSYLYFGPYTAVFLAWGGGFYIFGYSLLLKRNTSFNTIVGGLASPAPVWGGYAARYELAGVADMPLFLGIPLEGWLLGLLVFIWTPSHTWAMAVKNYEDYCNAEIPMLPVILGIANTAIINLIAGMITLSFGIFLVFLINPSPVWVVILVSILFFISLVKFVANPTVKEGTRNFHAHNLWLAVVFLVLLL